MTDEAPETSIQEMIEDGRHLVPEHMWGGVERYYLLGVAPGHFLNALLSNDLMEAFKRADDLNVAAMHDWVRFLYNFTPSQSFGSPERVRAWLAGFVTGQSRKLQP